MTSTVIIFVLVLAMAAVVVAYLWPRPEVRFEKLFVATLGALVGSLVARVLFNPEGMLHLLSLAGGSFVFAAVDWTIRGRRSYPRP